MIGRHRGRRVFRLARRAKNKARRAIKRGRRFKVAV